MNDTIAAPLRHDDEFRAIRIFDAETRHVATLHANFGAYKDGVTTAPSHNDMRALAALFVAAPDLLEALQTLAPMFAEWHAEFPEHVGDKEAPALQAALSAIAKATGTGEA